jgi:hypothetical protein
MPVLRDLDDRAAGRGYPGPARARRYSRSNAFDSGIGLMAAHFGNLVHGAVAAPFARRPASSSSPV